MISCSCGHFKFVWRELKWNPWLCLKCELVSELCRHNSQQLHHHFDDSAKSTSLGLQWNDRQSRRRDSRLTRTWKRTNATGSFQNDSRGGEGGAAGTGVEARWSETVTKLKPHFHHKMIQQPLYNKSTKSSDIFSLSDLNPPGESISAAAKVRTQPCLHRSAARLTKLFALFWLESIPDCENYLVRPISHNKQYVRTIQKLRL